MSGKIKLFVQGRQKSVMPWVALTALFAWSLEAQAVTPVWHNSLNSSAAATIDGGTEEGDAPTYPAGVQGNMFQSNANGDSWLNWGTSEVQAIFGESSPGAGDGWVDADGITVDLYFTGIDSSTHAGDSGLWSAGHRSSDNFVLIGVRDDQVRINFRNDAGGDPTHSATAGGGFIPTETYRLTLRQHSSLAGGAELYLDDLGGNVYDGVTPLPLAWDTPLPAGYVFNFPLEVGNDPALAMTIGNRHPFGSAGNALNNGEAIDCVSVFNGSHTPSEIGPCIPEPTSAWLMTLGLVSALLRRRRSRS